MNGALAQAAFFAVLVLAILVHEGAHFGVAKGFGFKVEEFFVGFGPRLWSFRRGETEYGLKLLPAGGYVRIAGMNPFEPVPAEDLPRSYGAKPRWQRALVIAAGPSTHLVVAFAFFAVWLGTVGAPRIPVVEGVERRLDGQDSPAFLAGLRPGDVIVGVGPVEDPTDDELLRYTRSHVGRPIELRVERAGKVLTVTVTPVLDEVDGERIARIGVLLSPARDRPGPAGAVLEGAGLVARNAVLTVEAIGRLLGPQGIGRVFEVLLTNAPRRVTDPVSPIGVGRAVGQIGGGDVLYVFGAVNVFIGLLNLLPVPPFDGGHLAILAVERVRGRRVDARKVAPISAAVAAFFVLLGLSVLYLDIVKPVSLLP